MFGTHFSNRLAENQNRTRSSGRIGWHVGCEGKDEAAGAQGRFWEMHDLLFENQNALEDENLAQYAAVLGLDEVRLIREVLAASILLAFGRISKAESEAA
jgi:hypothetical protein